MSDLGQAVLENLGHRLLKEHPAQIRACLDALSDEDVWSRPNPDSNSVGNLVLHLCGSTRHFLGRGVGGTDYQRDRPAEFAEKGPISGEALRRTLDETVAEVERILSGLTSARLLEISDRAGDPMTVIVLLLRQSHHWSVHTGQIIYATKAAKAGVFHELTMKTMPRPSPSR